VEEFGRAKRRWLKTFLKLPHGILSHDTFGRVFGLLNPEQFRRGFIRWVRAVNKVVEGQIVPIDGKKLRRSRDRTLGKNAIHTVSAWASENSVVLGQIKVDDKSNEITAIPQLLDLLEISCPATAADAGPWACPELGEGACPELAEGSPPAVDHVVHQLQAAYGQSPERILVTMIRRSAC